MIRRHVVALLATGALMVLVACSGGEGAAPTTPVSTIAATSTSSSSSTSSTSTSTTSSTTTTTLPFPAYLGEEVIGTSVEGRPITVQHRGDPDGIPVLVVGVIHGDENDGLAILDLLRTAELPAGIDLYLMDAMNPDGLAHDVRGNANGVDLNRNFPHDWTAIASPGQWEYSGAGPASAACAAPIRSWPARKAVRRSELIWGWALCRSITSWPTTRPSRSSLP